MSVGNSVAQQQLQNQSDAIIAAQNTLLSPSFYSDYNPPQFNISQQQVSYSLFLAV